ncbi:MAG: dienelactone hydrolase family protein [Nocardioidaceae bacterium]
MAEILLLHHAQGLTTGLTAFADRLREAGHTVHTPDVYDGQTFASLEDGIAYAKQVGFGELVERGTRAADGLPGGLVYAGFSLGVMAAQRLAQTRPGARGALLFEAAVPATEFSDTWPDDVPLQVHGMDADPEFATSGDLEVAKELVAEARTAELFTYPGDQHLFADSSLSSYDAGAADLLTERVLAFLAKV